MAIVSTSDEFENPVCLSVLTGFANLRGSKADAVLDAHS
jgi:hypothetical protein